MADRTITGAIISISVTPRGGENITIGRAMSLDVVENYQLRPIVGIGNFSPVEIPVMGYMGSMRITQFLIDSRAAENVMSQFKRQGTPSVPTKEAFIKQLLCTEGVDVTIMRKTRCADGSENATLAKITGAVCQSETMSIQEQQVVMKSGDFLFTDPISV